MLYIGIPKTRYGGVVKKKGGFIKTLDSPKVGKGDHIPHKKQQTNQLIKDRKNNLNFQLVKLQRKKKKNL